ncbi:hypothetical protein IHV09_15245 [Fictibacillus sp. 23RED33]|uniref:hypothetical protein n=1 Tax=Fictibacillus sp. 23RED33 TaxID=2745879 RepID=UPI0018CD4F5C|nr:hypothetical protein [Fictibacillus sp. 23RED33]MBH0174923.1 hypothetical protein [Fictibacillus sp. 23RED33]
MVILTGIVSLSFMCISVLYLSSFTVSLQEKCGLPQKKRDKKDQFSYLFDVYGD